MTMRARLWAVLGANLALVGALVGVGAAAHSFAVWAEGADYLADAAAIAVSLFAIHLSASANSGRPGDYPRATRYAALVNAGWLLLLSALVIAGAAGRLVSGAREVHGLPVLFVSGAAALVMLGAAIVLAKGRHDHAVEDFNMGAVFLDTAADAAAAGGVAVTGGIIYAVHGLYWLDPSVALVIAAVVASEALKLLRRILSSFASRR